ncbi:MAG: saccharopine dehydrogenase family protein [Gammaproteobacteria bacterium]
MSGNKRVVVIGGTGHFGGRICHRLVGDPNTELLVTSRSLESAQALVRELQSSTPKAEVSAAELNQSLQTFPQDLAKLRPDIVIHTAGPYQGQDYRVAEACIACGSHYVDLADGREFVEEFDSLNARAKAKGVLLVSGASTLPGLSSAIVDYLYAEFDTISAVEISIAPAHQTPRGPGTIAAVLSYCGKPFQVLEDGEWVTRYGWQNMRRQSYPEVGSRWSAACDVPDLGLLAGYLPDPQTVTFHAALEAKWEQIALWLMAGLTRIGLIRSWQGLVPSFGWISDRLIGFGSDKGGMHVRVSGIGTNGRPMIRNWNLTARRNHGPEIPCTPALILARKLVAGKISRTGAVACLGLISMADFDAEVDDLEIDWEIREEQAR